MTGLKSSEVHWVVQVYIGVNEGYLGDFSYKTHRDFYPAFCDLALDPEEFPGKTTREKFIAILTHSEPVAQAAILRGVARRYPVGSEHQRSASAYDTLLEMARRCAESVAVATPSPAISSQVVDHALKDAAALLESRDPVSAVDRAHTALHGYLKAACTRERIEVPADISTAQTFKLLRQNHPALADLGAQHESLIRILQAMSTVVDALAPLRNRASLAHANDQLLSREDAVLAINATRTLIHYLDAKFAQVQ